MKMIREGYPAQTCASNIGGHIVYLTKWDAGLVDPNKELSRMSAIGDIVEIQRTRLNLSNQVAYRYDMNGETVGNLYGLVDAYTRLMQARMEEVENSEVRA